MMKSALFAPFAISLLYGCAAPLDKSAQPPGANESILVLGVNQPYNVTLIEGTIEGGEFKFAQSEPMKSQAIDGYATGRIKAGSILALTSVWTMSPNGIMLGVTYHACHMPAIMLFTVPRGKVVYLGSVDFTRYEINGKARLNMKYENRLAQAQHYVDAAFPQLRGKLEYMAPDFMSRPARCEVVVPIMTTSFMGLRAEPSYKTVEEAAQH